MFIVMLAYMLFCIVFISHTIYQFCHILEHVSLFLPETYHIRGNVSVCFQFLDVWSLVCASRQRSLPAALHSGLYGQCCIHSIVV